MEWMTGFKIFPQDIPQSMLKTLCKGMENKNMVKDEVLFLQGDPSGQFYIIIEGQLQLAIQDSPEEEVKLRLKRDADPVAFAQTDWNANKDSGMGKFLKILKSGIAFGELSMMDDTQRTTAVFCASATAQLCVIDRDLYNKTLRNFHKSKAGTQQLYGQISALATFKSWIPEIRQQLVDAAVVKRYGRGSYVIENGAKIDSMLIVLEGEVAAMSEKKKKSDYKDGVHTAVHMHGNKGENQVSHTHTRPSCGFTFLVQQLLTASPAQAELCIYGPGSLLGDIESFNGMKNYCMSAFVKSADCVVCVVPLDTFHQLAKISKHVYKAMKDNAKLKLEWTSNRYKEEKKKNNRERRERKKKRKSPKTSMRDLGSMTIIDKIKKERTLARKEKELETLRNGVVEVKLPEIVRMHRSESMPLAPSPNSLAAAMMRSSLGASMGGTVGSMFSTPKKRANNMNAGYQTDPTFNRTSRMSYSSQQVLKPLHKMPQNCYSGSGVSLNTVGVNTAISLQSIMHREQNAADLRYVQSGRYITTAVMRPVKMTSGVGR